MPFQEFYNDYSLLHSSKIMCDNIWVCKAQTDKQLR